MSTTNSMELKEQILNEFRNGHSNRTPAADCDPHELTIRSWLQKHQVSM